MSDSLGGQLVLRRRSKAALNKDEAHEMDGYEITGSHTRPGEWFQGEMFLRLTEGLCPLRMRGHTAVAMRQYQLPLCCGKPEGPTVLSFKYVPTRYSSPVFWKEFNSTGHKSGNMCTSLAQS